MSCATLTTVSLAGEGIGSSLVPPLAASQFGGVSIVGSS
jgi:hypothetical protein